MRYRISNHIVEAFAFHIFLFRISWAFCLRVDLLYRLKALQNIHNDLAQESTVTQVRFSRSEVKFKSVVDVATVQKKADAFAREYRELDNTLQSLNWTTELLD